MSRIIDKLVKASGGWEAFLYQTLKDVCKDVSGLYSKPGMLKEAKLVEIMEEAVEILEAYEETIKDRWVDESRKHNGKPNQAVLTPQVQKVVEDNKVEEVVKPKSEGKELSDEEVTKGVSKSNILKLSDFILTPLDRSTPKPMRLKARVGVGKDVGACSGDLPISANSKIVNSQNLLVTTSSGHQLGSGSGKLGEEGQITGQSVSGHISIRGAYRLVFKDTQLGIALIHYDVVSLPSKLTKKQFEASIAVVNNLTVTELRERLEHFGMVYLPCNCGVESCFGWKIVDQAEVEAAEIKRESRLVAIRNQMNAGRVSN